jgi:hypothetical protein
VSHCERVYLDRAACVTRNARFFSDLGGDIAQRQGDVRKVPTAVMHFFTIRSLD